MEESLWFRKDIQYVRQIAWFFEKHKRLDTFIFAPGGGFFKDDSRGAQLAHQQTDNLQRAGVIHGDKTPHQLSKSAYEHGDYSYLNHEFLII